MSARVALLLPCVVTLLIAGCGSGNYSKAEQAANETVSLMEQLVGALESVRGPGDVDAAVGRIDQISTRLTAISAENKGVKLTKSENDRLTEMVKSKLAALQSRMQTAAANAGRNSQGSPKFMQALMRFQTAAAGMAAGG